MGFSYDAAGRARTDTVLPPRDFKSRASANSATAADLPYGFHTTKMGPIGLEPMTLCL